MATAVSGMATAMATNANNRATAAVPNANPGDVPVSGIGDVQINEFKEDEASIVRRACEFSEGALFTLDVQVPHYITEKSLFPLVRSIVNLAEQGLDVKFILTECVRDRPVSNVIKTMLTNVGVHVFHNLDVSEEIDTITIVKDKMYAVNISPTASPLAGAFGELRYVEFTNAMITLEVSNQLRSLWNSQDRGTVMSAPLTDEINPSDSRSAQAGFSPDAIAKYAKDQGVFQRDSLAENVAKVVPAYGTGLENSEDPTPNEVSDLLQGQLGMMYEEMKSMRKVVEAQEKRIQDQDMLLSEVQAFQSTSTRDRADTMIKGPPQKIVWQGPEVPIPPIAEPVNSHKNKTPTNFGDNEHVKSLKKTYWQRSGTLCFGCNTSTNS